MANMTQAEPWKAVVPSNLLFWCHVKKPRLPLQEGKNGVEMNQPKWGPSTKPLDNHKTYELDPLGPQSPKQPTSWL